MPSSGSKACSALVFGCLASSLVSKESACHSITQQVSPVASRNKSERPWQLQCTCSAWSTLRAETKSRPSSAARAISSRSTWLGLAWRGSEDTGGTRENLQGAPLHPMFPCIWHSAPDTSVTQHANGSTAQTPATSAGLRCTSFRAIALACASRCIFCSNIWNCVRVLGSLASLPLNRAASASSIALFSCLFISSKRALSSSCFRLASLASTCQPADVH